jgi:PA14 domain
MVLLFRASKGRQACVARPPALPVAMALAIGLSSLLAGCGRNEAVAVSAAPAPGLTPAEMAQAEQRGQLCTAANATGVGLRGEYFSKAGQAGETLLQRIDATIDFDAAMEWPTELAAKPPRSVRWSGWVKPPLSGTYRLHVTAPDAKLVVANREFQGPAAQDAAIELAAGRFYPVRIELDVPSSASARMRLEWTAPHGARYVVPRPLLFQPTEAVRTSGS